MSTVRSTSLTRTGILLLAVGAAAGCAPSSARPAVSATLTETPSQVQPAAAATYRVVVRNTGNVAVLASSLDTGLYANDQPAVVLGEPQQCQATATMRVCSVGPLAPGQSKRLTFYVRAPGAGRLTGHASYVATFPHQQRTAQTPTVTTPVEPAR